MAEYRERTRYLGEQPNPSTLRSVPGLWRVDIVPSEKRKASTTLPGKVEKIIPPHPFSAEPEKAQIAVEGADHLYREIRVPNVLEDERGQKVKLKEGADVDVKIEADPVVTTSGNGRQDSNKSPTPM